METVDSYLPKPPEPPQDRALSSADPENLKSGPNSQSWFSRYWGFWLVIAFIVYETTSQPALATLIACIKVGWDEFSMAAWLYRVDPDKRHVAPKMAIYIGFGLWKIALTACLVLISVYWILRIVQPNGGAIFLQFLRAVLGAIWALMLGFGLSTIFTLFAFLMALFGGSRLYAGQAVAAARHGHYWPPVTSEYGFFGLNLGNFARWLLLTAFFMIYGIFGAMIAQRIMVKEPDKVRRETKTMLFLSALGLGCLGGYLYLNWKVVARRPEDCWQLPDWAKQPPDFEDLGSPVSLAEPNRA